MFYRCRSLFFLLVALALVGKGWHIAKDGFSIRRTYFPLEKEASADPDREVMAALGQNYRYLGRGHQCYAFESADGKYVLKLLRHDRYTLPFWIRSCSLFRSLREPLLQDKTRRVRFMLNSFQIAFDELRDETALLYLHLGETGGLPEKTLLVDRLGRSYLIHPDHTAFVLQRKVPLMMPSFQASLKANDRARAQEILDAFLTVIKTRSQKGIFNKDPSFLRNFGFDGQGVQIDIGSFYRKRDLGPQEAFAPSFLQTVEHVKSWLAGLDPEMARWFNHRVEEIVQE